ncbi:helix-turn-helix domain-containing protein [Niallia circulans]|nr:ATP-binding protein [Niallia circulans]
MYDRILKLLEAGGETRNIEFKKTYDWGNPQHKAKIVKCILAMSNIKDGGHLVLGIDDEKQGEEKLSGMEIEHYEKLNYDHMVVEVNKFADPPVSFNMYPVLHEDKAFVLIRVPEFDEQPIICKRSGEQGLKEGAVFSRSKSKPESAIIKTQLEMRELIDIAIKKGIRQFYTRVRDSGLQLADNDTSQENYENELNGIDSNDILNQIKDRGYWRVIIRPTYYKENRIDSLTSCKRILIENKLSIRGWDFPHIRNLENGNGYVQATEDWGQFKELLRFYKSGQFVYYRALHEEYMEEKFQKRVNGKGLEILSTLYLYTEVYEFASRLAQLKLLGDEITIDIECHDIKGRRLFFYELGRDLYRDYISTIENNSVTSTESTVEELISNGNNMAIDALNQLFEKFNWDTSAVLGMFKEEQQKLLLGRY